MKNWIRIGIKQPEGANSSAVTPRSSRQQSNEGKFQRYKAKEPAEVMNKSVSKKSLDSLRGSVEPPEVNTSMEEARKVVLTTHIAGVPMTRSKTQFTTGLSPLRSSYEQRPPTIKNSRLKELRGDMLRQNLKNDIQQLKQLCSEAKALIKTMVTMFRRFYADASYNLNKLNNMLGEHMQSQFKNFQEAEGQLEEIRNGIETKYSQFNLKLPLHSITHNNTESFQTEQISAIASGRTTSQHDRRNSARQEERTRARRVEDQSKQLTSALARMRGLLNKKP